MIISPVNLGYHHDNLFTFFFLPSQKKEQIAVEFFNETTKPFLSLNLPQNKFHQKLGKNHKKFHPKIS
jgi:hypothetical protein